MPADKLPGHKVPEANPSEMPVFPVRREANGSQQMTLTCHHTLKHLSALSRMHNLQYHTEKMRKSKVSFFSNIAMQSVHAMPEAVQRKQNVPSAYTLSWKVVQLLQNPAPSP